MGTKSRWLVEMVPEYVIVPAYPGVHGIETEWCPRR